MKTVKVEGALLSADALEIVRDWQVSGFLEERLRGLSSVQDFLTNILIDTWGHADTFGNVDFKGMLVELMQLKEELSEFRVHGVGEGACDGEV